MNIFENLNHLQESYSTYVFTFQKFKNPVIREWVHDRIRQGTLLWKEPYIQLNRRFKEGDTIDDLIQEGILHPKCKDIFVRNPRQEGSEVIRPYLHQSESMRKVLQENQNIIITTGTGSGKSFCFGIPIVSKCLQLKEQGVEGIKAIIVYPMNALANSQYDDFAERLHESGLKIALYTGDTKNNPEEALQNLRDSANREPWDSEVLSREEIQNNPPDILMTNYVMLDLILTRFNDRKLFPPHHRGVLQFLVFDEIHTYSGKRGADVACLCRRLKERTETTGSIRCIGTSATVQSGEGESAQQLIADFASEMFGEPFFPENVIGEAYISLKPSITIDLPPITISEELINQFDGSVEQTAEIIAILLNDARISEVSDPYELGKKLMAHPVIPFLEEILLKKPQSTTDLAKEYRKNYRPDTSLSLCRLELQAVLLAGTVAQTQISDEWQPIFIPKLHTFFSQGRTIMSCITDKGPHLNDRGELTCTKCAERGLVTYNFPLHFCRACGQEYYGVIILDDQTLTPREIDIEETKGTPVYLYIPSESETEFEFPEDWLTKDGKPRKNYEDQTPRPAKYCPVCNELDVSCSHLGKVPLYIISYPFLLCPSCGVYYDRRPREFSKLFTFGTVGRSTGTDVLVSSLIQGLPVDQRKVIAFSDSRQDTALQAAHINHLYKRIHFRRGLYTTLVTGNYIEQSGDSLPINEIGSRIFEVYERTETLPDYSRSKSRFGRIDRMARYFQRYLVFTALNDLAEPAQRNQMNLEDVGLLKVIYYGLERLVKEENTWTNIPEFSSLSIPKRLDYITGFLDIFRRQKMIYDEDILNFNRFKVEVIDHLNEDALPDVRNFGDIPTGYSDIARNDRPRRARVLRLTTSRSRLVQWTNKVFGVEIDRCKEIVTNVAAILKDPEVGFLQDISIKGVGPLLMIASQFIELMALESKEHLTCPKCGTIYHFQELSSCTRTACPSLIDMDYSHNYFRRVYTADLKDAIRIEAEEHSGQLEGDERRKIEMRFKDIEDILNVLVCTPTMELGIDIGELSAIYMRNVPPNPSNYAQRAGRAGRKNQPSIITTFCGVGSARGPHDQYFYRFPANIIAGEISPPRFSLNNEKLLKAHIYSIIIEKIDAKIPGKTINLLDLEAVDPNEAVFPLFPDKRSELENGVQQKANIIHDSVKRVFKVEMTSLKWFNEGWIREVIYSFVDQLDKAFDYWRREYLSLLKEAKDIQHKLQRLGPDSELFQRERAIISKLENMREGKHDFYVFRYLGMQGFLPNYGFPSSNTYLSFYDRDDELARDQTIALSEFAPGNMIYLRGNRYRITYSRPKKEIQKLILEKILICPKCELALFGHDAALTGGACSQCGISFEEIHPYTNCMELPDMFATRSRRITSDEEERMRLGSSISYHYESGEHPNEFVVTKENKDKINLTYDHDANILLVNKGTRQSEDGFTLCTACNRWLFGEKNITRHTDPERGDEYCRKHATVDDLVHGIYLFTRNRHDVVLLDINLPEYVESSRYEYFYHSLKETILKALQVSLDLSYDELDAFLRPNPSNENEFIIVLYEKAEGGVGILQSLANTNRFREMVKVALELLHESEPEKACQRACYDCLLSFHNQRIHHFLDRNLVIPILQSLKAATINEETNGRTDTNDIDSLLKLCESRLEKDVLLKISELGLRLPDEAQKMIYSGDRPVAKVDFFYKPNIVLFVDGPAHEQDFVIQDDERKRRELRGLGYRVFAVKSQDEVNNLKDVLK